MTNVPDCLPQSLQDAKEPQEFKSTALTDG